MAGEAKATMVVRIAGNLADLKKALEEGRLKVIDDAVFFDALPEAELKAWEGSAA